MVAMSIGGKPHLVVIGGKEKIYDAAATNTVYKLNIEEYIKAKGTKATDKTVEWEQIAAMNEARCMFAAVVVNKKYIYVFGGTKEGLPSQNTMPSSLCERYDPSSNLWTPFPLADGPGPLSSFGWCPGTDSGVIYVLGGSDGFCLQSSLWRVDFAGGKAEYVAENESAITGNKMICIMEGGKEVIYSIGGANSDGYSYKIKLDEAPEWIPLEK